MVACVASIVILVLNFIFYKKEFREVIKIVKGYLKEVRRITKYNRTKWLKGHSKYYIGYFYIGNLISSKKKEIEM